MKKYPLIFACILVFTIFVQAQDYQVFTYDSQNGLPSIVTKAIAQDSLGFIWIASDNGLVRFDGINFKVFNKGLPSNIVKGFFVFKNKQFIALTDLGIVEIESKIDTAYFTEFIKSTDNKELIYIKSVLEASDGSLWFCGIESIICYKNKTSRTYAFDKKNNTSSYFRGFSMVEDSMGNLFAFSQQGFFYKYDKKSDRFFEIKTVGRLPLINGTICIQFGEIIIATEDGVRILKYDKSLHFSVTSFMLGINFSCIGVDINHSIFIGSRLDGLFNLYRHKGLYQFENLTNLPTKSLNNVFVDKEDNVWLSTDAGIILLNSTFFSSSIKGLKQMYISDIKKDLKNTIYVSNDVAACSLYYENNRMKANLLLSKENGDIIQFMPVGEKFLCSNSAGELGWFKDGEFFKIPNQYGTNIFLLHDDMFGNIWLCKINGEDGILKLSPDNKISLYNSKFGNLTRRIISLAHDSLGTLYCGASSDTAYLFKYDRNADVFRNISIPIKFEHDKMIEVHDIAILGKCIYLATTNGLLLIENNTISRFPIKGFENQNTKFIKIDKDNNLWLGYDRGVVKYNKSQITLFDKKDGLPANTLVHRNIVIDQNNNVFVGTTSGLAYSLKNNIPGRITPSPIIVSIKFNGVNSTNKTSILEGSYANFRFISLSYPGKEIKYQTKIVGKDNNWTTETYSNDLFIPKLESGTYVLYIRALQHGNYQWSQPSIFSFTVKANWYNSWWAYGIYPVFLFLIIWVIVKLNTHRLRNEKELLENIVKDSTNDILQKNEALEQQKEEIFTQTEQLQIAYNKLQELDQFKQGMTSMIVHDLKNPLNLILNMPNTLDTDKKDKLIQQSGKQMLNMVLNILDVDKYEETSMKLNLEDKQFVLIAINAINQIKFLSEQKEISINNQIDRQLFTKVEEEIVERIMVNLLTNAIKYTPLNGSITITSYPMSETFVRIEINDTGEGIPEDKIHLVFQKFGQIVAKKSGAVRSTGLGLTFCKLAVEAHGGEIGLNTEERKGTTFWFTLKIGTPNKTETQIIEKEIMIKDDFILFTEEEKASLKPFIDQLKAFTIYEVDDIADIIEKYKPNATQNIQKWIAEIEKNLVTLNQAKYLELLKIS